MPDSQFTIEQGFSGTPVWDVEDRAVAGLIVEGWTRGRRSGFMIPTSVLLAAWPHLAGQVWPASPFRGLRSFTERDSAMFFGRDDLVDRIVKLTEHAPALTVVGPSGSGKSSLLHAGVLPKLRQRPGLVVAIMRPSEAQTPLRALALALARAAEPDADPLARGARIDDFADRLTRGLIAEVVGAVIDRRGGQRLLLVLDQFEEVFIADEDLEQLAPALMHCLRPQSRMDLLTGLRADFLGRVLQHRELAELVRDVRLITVGELNQSELRAAIVEPVRRTRLVRYEAGLVDRLLTDVGVAPGRLPLLQFTLARLWEDQQSGELTHRAYDAIGGVDSALARHAEAVWSGLGAAERSAAGRLLVQLLYPLTDGVGFIRRAAPRAQLDDAQWNAAQRLAADRARLVVVRAQDSDQVAELAHDALVTHWQRLGELGELDREFREWQELLRQRIRQWQRRSYPTGRLLTGTDLRDALRWRAHRVGDFARIELSYVDVSRRRRGKLRRRWASGVAVVAVVTVLIVTQQQAGVASKAADTMISGMSQTDPYAKLRTTLRAYRTSATEKAKFQVDAQYARYARIDRVLPDYTDLPITFDGTQPNKPEEPSAAAQKISADGKTLVSTDPQNNLTLWRVNGNQVTGHPLGQTADRVTISRDGRYVAYLQDSRSPIPGNGAPRSSCAAKVTNYCVDLYDTVTRQRRQLGILSPGLSSETPLIRFDPTGQVVAAVFEPNYPSIDAPTFQQRVLTWDVASGRQHSDTVIGGAELQAVRDMWLAPGGDQLLLEPGITSHPGGQVLYNVLVPVDLTAPTARVAGVADDLQVDNVTVSEDGDRVAALIPPPPGSGPKANDKLVIRDVGTARQLAELPDIPPDSGIALDEHGNQIFVTDLFGTTSIRRVDDAAARPITLHADQWQDVMPAGSGTDTALVLIGDDVIGLVLPAPGQPTPEQRLAAPPPYVPGKTSPQDEHPDQWAGEMNAMLASAVPSFGEVTDLPAGAYTGPLGG